MSEERFSKERVLEAPDQRLDTLMKEVFSDFVGDIYAEYVIRLAFRLGWVAAFSQQQTSLDILTDLYSEAFVEDSVEHFALYAANTTTKQ